MVIRRSMRTRAAVLILLAIVAIAATITTRRLRAAAAFTPGNVVVYRVGTGTGSLVNTGSPVFIDEFTPAGTLVQSIALPTTTIGLNRRLVASGTATSEGLLTRSADGHYLVLAGYDAPIPTTGLAGTSSATVPRVVGRVDALAGIDTSTGLTDWASANNPRGVASSDGSNLWVGGAAGGVRYTTLGSSTSTQLSTTVVNIRGVAIFGGQVYESDSSGTAVRLGAVGAGLPITSGQTITNLPGFPLAGSPYGFFFADLDGAIGLDTLYVADDTNGVPGAITKYSLVAGSWVGNGTAGAVGDSYRGLTGVQGGGTVTLYATRKGGSGSTGGGELVRLLDTSGFNGAFSATPTLIATAAANTAFRGVALAPFSGVAPPAVSLSVSTHSASEAAQTAVTVTATTSAPVVGNQSVALIVSGSGITSGDYSLSAPTITIADGETSGSVTFTALNDGVLEGAETATLTMTAPSAGLALGSPVSQDVSIIDNSVAPPACSVTPTPIHDVQGAGFAAAMAGTVTLRGAVVGDYEGPSPALRGFYLQDLNPDLDPATSEGIFVFEGSNANVVSIGQVVQVTGDIDEFQDQTEIRAATIENCGITASVTPVDVTLPVPPDAGGVPYLERFEGMLVRFNQTLYVTEHFQLGRFGQLVMSSSGRLPQPTSISAPGAPALAQQAANDRNRIILDDDVNNQNPDPILFGRLGIPLSASNTLRGGDTATNVSGVLTYGWAGNSASGNAYRLRPLNALVGGMPNFQPSNPRPASAPAISGSLKVVGMNVLNYFLTLDNGQAICGPAPFQQQCRGAETATELTRQQQKLNQALLKLNADVIGMSELENTPGVDPLADIAGRLNASLGSSVYAWIDTGAIGTDAIRVGILYKSAAVTPIGAPMVDFDPAHNRPPVAQLFSQNATSERFTIVVNHFKSKGCGSSPNPLDSDQNDGQGCFNARRVQQAQALASFVQGTVLPTTQDPDVMLVGDFNSYAKEDPIKTLEFAGFTNLVSFFAGPQAYSYVFDGQWGYLDYALVSTSMLTQVAGAADYHINADEPSVLDYNTNFKSGAQQVSLFNGDEFRIADHDPVVIGLALHPFPMSVGDPYSMEAGTTLTVGSGLGVLANDTGGPLAVFSHTSPAHGTLTLNGDGSFTYTPNPGFVGTDTFQYTATNAVPLRSLQRFAMAVAPLATIGGVTLTGGAFGSAVAPVPGSADEFYGLTDRGPNVDGPGGTLIEPVPSFTPSIAKFKLVGGQAQLEAVIPLKASDGTPYSGRVNTLADTGETVTDINGNVLATDPNGFDSEGLVALADGTFWVSDEYGPFLTHFDATGKEIARLSPFDGSLPPELAKRVVNRGMEGVTITPDGSMLVGIMQSALQQADLGGLDAKSLTPLRIVTYRLSDGVVHEYLYLLDNPNTNKTAASEITVLSNTVFLVLERDGNYPPSAYKKIFMIDISAATDVGPQSAVPGVYDGANGGLLIGGKTIENLLRSGGTPFNTATSLTTLAANGITPALKGLHLDLGALLVSVDAQGRFFSHDKIEGVAAINGGGTLVITNDSDFGIDAVTNAVAPFLLHAKITPAGIQDDGEFLVVDLVRSTATVTIQVSDTTAPVIAAVTPNPSSLWPVNKRMVPVSIAVNVSDTTDAAPQCSVTGVTSNQGTSADWMITGPLGVSLRADRAGKGGDRFYTIAVRCTDASGNASTATTIVTVPHDQGK